MEHSLSIVVTGPPSRNLLREDLQETEQNPFKTAFPLIGQLARGYCELGCRTTYVTTCEGLAEPRELPGCHEALTVACLPRRRVQWCMCDLYRQEVRLMAEAIRARAPDAVHALWTYEYADAALRSGAPTLVTAHDSPWRVAWLHRRPIRFERAVYSQLAVLPRIRHLSTVSPYMVGAMRKHGYRRPIEVIPNGVPLAQFAAAPRGGLRDPSRPTIAGVSEWYPLKNPGMLFDAFKFVRGQRPEAQLLVFGHGFQPKGPAECYARSIGVTEGVTYFGYARPETVRRVLCAQADVFFHPTLEESFGMTFVEAMALGVPCVGGRASGAIPWLLDGGRAGVLVDVKNVRSVVDGLLALIRNPDTYHGCAAGGYQRAKDCFLIENVCKQYKACLLQMNGSKSRKE